MVDYCHQGLELGEGGWGNAAPDTNYVAHAKSDWLAAAAFSNTTVLWAVHAYAHASCTTP